MEGSDLMNETLLVAFEKFDKVNSEEAFFSFLCGIAVRLLSNENKRQKLADLSIEKQVKVIDINDRTELKTEVRLLHEALAKLPEIQKEALILFEISGFSIIEIAEMQESSPDAVKQRLKRGREKLKSLLTVPTLKEREVNHE
jgi:RNA polymerase sigma-70 factor (ECF subfamily)